MDFSLTEEQKMLKAMVRDFAARELEPIAAQIDEEARFPAEAFAKMADLGMMGLGIAREYGGSGGGVIEIAIAAEELSRVCASLATTYVVTLSDCCHAIYSFGSEEQKQRFVVPLATGDKIGAYALTEANAGSDPSSLETTATRKNGGYVINGTKVLITSAVEAEIVVVFATIDKSLKHRGVTGFVVEKGTPGFSVGKLEHKLGIRSSSLGELLFEDCFVPEANRLGKEGDGFKIALDTLDSSRIGIAALAVGIAQGAFDRSLAYAKERQQFGQCIASFQAIQWMLADMATQIDAARLLTHRAAHLKDCGLPFIKEAAMAKVFAAETAMFVTTKAIQIHGGYGYTTGYPVERYFRDAKVTEIYEGTSEMQRLTIARRLISEG